MACYSTCSWRQFSSKDPKQLELLKTEYQLVLKRAPEIKIINPSIIPDTALANTYIKSTYDKHRLSTDKSTCR